MALTNDIVSQFVKITNDNTKKKSETTVYGTIVEYDGSKYIKLDGSDLLTPISATTNSKDGDRVTGTIKDHTLTVTGNITSPSATTGDVDEVTEEIGTKISEFEVIIADKVDTEELNVQIGRIDTLVSDNVTIRETLDANVADIETLIADNATINDTLTALNADITKLEAEDVTISGKLDAVDADIESLQADNVLIRDNLTATEADITKLKADNVTINETLTAQNAEIENLETTKLSTKDAEVKYANIDFSNIGEAAMEYLYAESGLIKDVTIGDGTITGHLVGVTISGDLIEGNTIVAEKLVIKGEDGLYYKLNTDGVTTETEQTEYNSINGSIITANSITATKINVDDLVAFDATIGGFNITENSLYSGVKSSVDNTTRGIYLDNDGQIAFGDSNNFIKFYKDTDGRYKLAISASAMTFSSSNKSVEEAIEELKDEITTNLRIDSSRGTVFKNNAVSTVLSAVIYRGSQRITDIDSLHAAMGTGAYLQWKWQRLDDDTFGVISASDSRIGNGGFTLTLTPDDVDTKVTFMCELIA